MLTEVPVLTKVPVQTKVPVLTEVSVSVSVSVRPFAIGLKNNCKWYNLISI
ncbi:MAG: hypothetical protein ACM3PT_05845 [Deltaproteobacteria bacterium]